MSSSAKSAEWYRAQYTDISGSGEFVAATDDTTLVTGKTGWTIFIQKIIAYVDTSAAQSVAFQDNASTPKKIAEIPATPQDETRWEFDWGARGVPLTEAKNFVANVSAAGLAFDVVWEGYSQQTALEYLRNAGTVGTGQAFA